MLCRERKGRMPRHNNVYHYDDKTFSSIKALAAYTGINEKTLTARLWKLPVRNNYLIVHITWMVE